MRKGWSSWRRLRGDLINAYKHLKTGSQVDGARHFPVLCSNKTNGNRHKLEHKMIHMDKRKSFFILRVPEHWSRLPREAVESPSLKIFKTCLNAFLCNLLWDLL